jgi:hypothetical protein
MDFQIISLVSKLPSIIFVPALEQGLLQKIESLVELLLLLLCFSVCVLLGGSRADSSDSSSPYMSEEACFFSFFGAASCLWQMGFFFIEEQILQVRKL